MSGLREVSRKLKRKYKSIYMQHNCAAFILKGKKESFFIDICACQQFVHKWFWSTRTQTDVKKERLKVNVFNKTWTVTYLFTEVKGQTVPQQSPEPPDAAANAAQRV